MILSAVSHLRPPAIEKNFLISPPGSPPVGWEQTREEPPNDAPLAEDLINALRRLQISQEQDVNPGLSVLVKPEEGSGVGVYVEDCSDEEPATESDSDQGEGWYYSQPSIARLVEQQLDRSYTKGVWQLNFHEAPENCV